MIELIGIPCGGEAWRDPDATESKWLFPLESVRFVKWAQGQLEVDTSAVANLIRLKDTDAAIYTQLRGRLVRGGY